MAGSYQLSHEEQQAAKLRALSESRTQRLLQVRLQEKELSRKRNAAFKVLCRLSEQQLKQQLAERIQQQREQQLEELREQYARCLAQFGAAHKDAISLARQREVEERLRQQQRQEWERSEKQRFEAAMAIVRAAREQMAREKQGALDRRQDALAQDRQRARALAEAYRRTLEGRERQAQQMALEEEQRRRRNQHSKIDYKYSRLHELGVPQLVVNNKQLDPHGPDPAAEAASTQEQLAEMRRRRALQAEQDRQQARERGEVRRPRRLWPPVCLARAAGAAAVLLHACHAAGVPGAGR
jgi:hypothetical protein